jgi:hypothetical protein
MVIVLENLNNMGKLFTFGDSFTFNKMYKECEYSQKYRKNDELHWPDIIANKLNLTLCNFGYGSLSNDRILDNIIEKIDLIEPGDVVIIGKSFFSRFDIPNSMLGNTILDVSNELMKQFTTIGPNARELLYQLNFTKSEVEHIEFFLCLINNETTIKRQNLRFEFTKKYLVNKGIHNVVFWEVENNWTKYENIKTATNGEIDDLHWSFKGHAHFADFILDEIKKPKKRSR